MAIGGTSRAKAGVNAEASVEGARLYREPRLESPLIGKLRRGTHVEVLSKSADGTFLRVEAKNAKGVAVQGYAEARDFEIPIDEGEPARPARRSSRRHEAREEDVEEAPRQHWAFGAGFAGYSSGGTTNITVSGDARYLWTPWTETLLGLDLTFSDTTYLGTRVGERFYAPLAGFRPYVHTGFRVFDISTSGTAALELGGGFQVVYGGGRSFFDLGVTYLVRTPFNELATNGWVFGGTSGLRF